MRGAPGSWLRLPLIPVAILLLTCGVWLVPATVDTGRLASTALVVAWGVLLVVVLKAVAGQQLEPGERDSLAAELFVEPDERVSFLARFTTLLTLAGVIATLGLLESSTAVVIGAMVVAPLMTPLMSVAGGLTLARPDRVAEAAAVVLAGSALTVAVGAVLSWVVPGTQPTSELLARTQPGLSDLGIALAAGAAGGYVSVRRRDLGALPGVAIAVALVPPLATVGVMLELGRAGLARGALILFATNAVAIVLAAAIVFLLVGLVASPAEARRNRRLRIGFAVALLATLLVMVPLGRETVLRFREESADQRAREAVEGSLARSGTTVDGVDVTDDGGGVRPTVVVVDVAGPEPPSARALARALASALEAPVEVRLRWRYGDSATSPAP